MREYRTDCPDCGSTTYRQRADPPEACACGSDAADIEHVPRAGGVV